MWNSKSRRTAYHNCRRKMFGNPKVGNGICWWRKYRASTEERIEGKRNAKAFLDAWNAGMDLDDLEI